jgi:hypothetical protein
MPVLASGSTAGDYTPSVLKMSIKLPMHLSRADWQAKSAAARGWPLVDPQQQFGLNQNYPPFQLELRTPFIEWPTPAQLQHFRPVR